MRQTAPGVLKNYLVGWLESSYSWNEKAEACQSYQALGSGHAKEGPKAPYCLPLYSWANVLGAG